jgi:hypothetical protein
MIVCIASLLGVGCSRSPSLAGYADTAGDDDYETSGYENLYAAQLSGLTERPRDEPRRELAVGGEAAEAMTYVTATGSDSYGVEASYPVGPSPTSSPPTPPADVHRAGRLASAAVAPADADRVVSDATASSLIVYTAGFHVGVYQVQQAQTAIAEAATALGGYIASQTDDSIVIRVPAARFYEAVERVSGTGDVLHRDVAATDVSEEFRDNDIRLQNLEAMRTRLEELLRRASSVEEALLVERELERITVELESLRGRQRFLSDRIALSTIAVTFRAIATESIGDAEFFVLPFPWLRTLGISSLLRVE